MLEEICKNRKAEWILQALFEVQKITALLHHVVWSGRVYNILEIFMIWAGYGWSTGLIFIDIQSKNYKECSLKHTMYIINTQFLYAIRNMAITRTKQQIFATVPWKLQGFFFLLCYFKSLQKN